MGSRAPPSPRAVSAAADHVSHLENVSEEEINRLLGMVVDVENLFMSVHKEEDTDTKQVYFYLFKVRPSVLLVTLCPTCRQLRSVSPVSELQSCCVQSPRKGGAREGAGIEVVIVSHGVFAAPQEVHPADEPAGG